MTQSYRWSYSDERLRLILLVVSAVRVFTRPVVVAPHTLGGSPILPQAFATKSPDLSVCDTYKFLPFDLTLL